MAQDKIRVCDLAHELHVSSRELVQTARALGINVIRATASLSPSQVNTLRANVENLRANRQTKPRAAPTFRTEPKRQDDRRWGTCSCCQYPFTYVSFEESHEICSECREHFERPGEAGWQTQIRLQDHVQQSRAKVDAYREASDKLSKERDEAYAKRNKWMAALVEIVVAHGPSEDHDGCECGAPEFPCVTRRHLSHVNRGIYRRCEELEGLNEDEFNRVLYGGDYRFFAEEWDDAV